MQEIFLPIIESTIPHLYKVTCAKCNDGDLRFSNYNVSMADEGSGLELLFEKFEAFFREEIEAQIIIKENETQKSFKYFSESTQSITLGLLCEAYRFTHNLSHKEKWKSITITGDVKITADDKKETAISSVTEIETKFMAVCKYADEHPLDILEDKKHLFLYVGKHEAELQDHDDIEVLYFSEKNTFQEIFAEIFDGVFTEEQTNFLKNAIVGNRSFIETATYRKLKKEYDGDKCKGFLLEGMGDTGKSITAFAFCQYLMSTEKIYAPIWITVKNDDEIKKIINDAKKDINLPGDRNLNISRKNIASLQLGNPGIRDISVNHAKSKTLVDYFMERIKKILADTLENFDGGKIREEFIEHEYMIVIDNLEQNIENEVLTAVYDIYKNIGRQMPLIVTSRSTKADSNLLEKLCIVKRKMEPFSKENVRFLAIASAKNSDISYKFKVSPEKFNKYIDALFDSFKEMPSLISITVPFLKGDTIDNQIEKIRRLEGYEIQEKINDVFSHTLAKLDLFSQIVLYALIKSDISGETPSPQNICEMILEKIFENKQLAAEENVNYSFGELDTQNIIQRNEKNEYILKHVALTYYVFTETLGIGVKNARDIFLTPAEKLKIAIKFERVEDVKNLLEEYKDDVEKLQLEANLSYAAGSCENVEFMTSLLDLFLANDVAISGFDIYGNSQETIIGDIPIIFTNWGDPIPLFISAANNKNDAIFELLILKGADPIMEDNDDNTLLHCAALNPNEKIINLVLAKGYYKDINQKNKYGMTPLISAVSKNTNTNIIKTLLQKGADITIVDKNNLNALYWSAMNENQDVVKLILKSDTCDVNSKDINGETPLMCALVYNKNIEVIKELINAGSNTSIKSNAGLTALHAAAQGTTPEILQYLLELNCFADINIADNYGHTPIMIAAQRNSDTDILEILIKNGADISARNNMGVSVLHFAALNEHEEIIKYILENKLYDNIDVTDNEGNTPLIYALVHSNNIKIIISLIDAGADRKIYGEDTIIYYAALNNNSNVLKYFINENKYTDINVQDADGLTPLLLAARNNSDEEGVKALIEAGADIDQVITENLLLCFASCNENTAIIEYILEHHYYTDINARFENGKTSILLATAYNSNFEILFPLLDKEADISLMDYNLCNWWHYLTFNKNYDEAMRIHVNYMLEEHGTILQKLINKKAKDGNTPLHYAVQNENPAIYALLLKNGAKENIKNKKRRTAISDASEEFMQEVAKFFEK